jgi:opacity protein-like surface antigen
MISKGNGFKNCIVVAVLLLALPALVLAEDKGVGDKGFSIGPRAVYSTAKDADSGQWSGGAQVRLHLSPAMGLECSVDSISNSFFSNLVKVKTYPVQVSLLAYLMPGAAVSPFLLGGAGMYYTQVDVPVVNYSDTTSRLGMHAGAGVEMMLNESLSLDATYRYVWLEDLKSKDANLQDKNFQDTGSMVTIALNFLF